MNSENITISKKAGTIAITSQAEPANPTLTYSSISESWVRRNGNVLTIDANTGSSNRSFSLSVTATTIEDAAYDGIATDSKTFIITQNGTCHNKNEFWLSIRVKIQTCNQKNIIPILLFR